ncbi:hypothetical protein [Roseibacillus ishigakijimensis]|uniref:Uncharacterized protein n=1 Tax=Roseibacillus ishigakijimensis TaxID=454146 RepID=A0A934VHJ0_9BACT|nr:hypothetical protein [Roseibacillus ishigakijimensis]MBK1834018.1 hypothetical protein [Roseibacillus ishigakijimensis]
MSDEESSREKRKKRVRKSDSGSRGGSLYEKREKLLKEMQSNADLRSIDVREQVELLKEASDESSEESWGSKRKRRKGSPWMLWAIVGLVIPIVLVGLMIMTAKQRHQADPNNADLGIDFDVLSGGGQEEPEDWFVENSGPSFTRAVEVLESLSEDSLRLEDIETLVRSRSQAGRLIAWQQAGEWAGFNVSQPTNLTWEYGSVAEVGYMTVHGVRSDFRNFRAYFVKAEDGLVLDADATEGYSEIPIAELPGQDLSEPVLVRAWVAKEPHFDTERAPRLSRYQILAPNQVDFVWATCEKGSDLDEALREELNYGRLIGERKKEFRAAVRLSNGEGLRPDEFVLTELVSPEWVLVESE